MKFCFAWDIVSLVMLDIYFILGRERFNLLNCGSILYMNAVHSAGEIINLADDSLRVILSSF